MKIAIIVPAYNEGQVISGVVVKIKATLPGADVVVIDDGSRDETSQQARAAGALVLRHRINRGQGASIKTGIDFVSARGYETAVFFDADGQMAETEITNFLDKIDAGYEVVLGSRNLGRTINMPLAKNIIKKLALIYSNWSTGLPLTDTHNGFQAWRLCALRRIQLTQDRYAYASQLLNEISRLKLKYVEIPVTISYTDYSNKKGQSLWSAIGILWDLLVK